MRKLICGMIAVLAASFVAADAQAATVTLDFDTAATGGDIVADGSVTTALGTVSLDCPGTCIDDGSLFFDQSTDADFATLSFDFEASTLVFEYTGNGSGVFTAEALDIHGNVVDSFFDPSTSGGSLPGSPDGTITLTGAGIVALRFADSPNGGAFASIDSLEITGAAAIPLPASLPLLGVGMLVIGVIGRRRRI